MKDEGTVQQEIQIQARYEDCHLMRNNSGACIDDTGRLVRYGLGNISKQHNDRIASSDLIGFTTIRITEEMVGKEVAVFTAVEVKKEAWNPEKKLDKREAAQAAFIKWVQIHGGIAGFCNSVDKLKELFRK